MKATKRITALLIVLILALSSAAQASADEAPTVEAGIAEIKQYGNIVLTIGAESMTALGYEAGDVITVEIGGTRATMPIGTAYSDVDIGEAICCYKTSSSGIEVVVLAINGGDLTSTMGFAECRECDAEPGYEWVFANGVREPVTVTITMAEKQGYAEGYRLHQLTGARSNNRDDYANLSDAEYANFRAVETSGMGVGTLYRSSSPINPALNRNREADEALLQALIRTVVNMADSDAGMRQFPDFNLTHYSECDIIALNMGINCFDEEFQKELVEGLRYMIAHDGPYLIHCKEGKDRAGFAAAILECLMGADADEIVKDYMLSYYYFYGVEPGTETYEQIAAGNIEAALARAFGIPSIRDESADLQTLAETYLEGIGMGEDEISLLKDRLGRDYGGLN